MFPKRVITVYALLAVAFLINASFTLGQSVTSSPSVSQSTGDWPQFRFSPAQIGYNPFEDVLNLSNVPHLKVFWSDIGIGGGFIPSSPVIAKGVVYSANGDGGLFLGAATMSSPLRCRMAHRCGREPAQGETMAPAQRWRTEWST
jgi:hypothetical protein